MKERFRKVFDQRTLLKIISESSKNPYKNTLSPGFKNRAEAISAREEEILNGIFLVEPGKTTLVAKKFFN